MLLVVLGKLVALPEDDGHSIFEDRIAPRRGAKDEWQLGGIEEVVKLRDEGGNKAVGEDDGVREDGLEEACQSLQHRGSPSWARVQLLGLWRHGYVLTKRTMSVEEVVVMVSRDGPKVGQL